MRRYCKIITVFIALLIILGLIPPTVLHQAQAQTQEMTITEILSELASVSTQEESETAIRHLFDKTGVGVSGKESRYRDYVVSDEGISELAEQHLSSLNNGSQITIGYMYNNTKYIVNIWNESASDSEKISLFDLDEALTELQSQATAALDDKETPNNAFLIAIFAEGATIPDPIPVYDSTTVRSPVQEFLFSLWLHQEGTPHSKSVSGETKSTIVSNSYAECSNLCFATYSLTSIGCITRPLLVAVACELGAFLSYNHCLGDCPPPTGHSVPVVFLNAIGPVSVGDKIKIYTIIGDLVKEYWVTENNIDNGYTVWDGRDSEGLRGGLGAYVYKIYDENNTKLGEGSSALLEDTTPPQIMDESYDTTNNKIHFKLKDIGSNVVTPGGYVQIEINDSSGNLIDTIWDWRLKLGESSLSSGICDIPYTNTTAKYYQAKIIALDVAGNSAEKIVSNIPPKYTAPYVSTKMTVDGKLNESAWDIATDISKVIYGTTDNTAKFGVLWDSYYLYVGIRVLDKTLRNDSRSYPDSGEWLGNLHDDDSVEIAIDGNHSRDGGYDEHDAYFLKGWEDNHLDGEKQKGVLHAWATILVDDEPWGYNIELAIPWTNLGITPTAGMTIGFSVGYNDDDNGGTRDAQVVWSGTGNNYVDTSELGEIVLGEVTGLETINNLVTFDEPINQTTTYGTTTVCGDGFVGKFSFDATLTNTSNTSLSDLVVKVRELTDGYLLQNADGGAGGVGASLTVPEKGAYADGILSKEESVAVHFIICLPRSGSFRFVVDVLGSKEAASSQALEAPQSTGTEPRRAKLHKRGFFGRFRPK